MDSEQFRHALRSGLGRGILYARDHDVRAFRNIILDSCLHCYAVDPENGTRAGYMWELLELIPDRNFYYDEILKALPGSGDDWDAVHRFHLAMNLAVEGNDRAKRAMYASFDPGPRMAESIGSAFVRIDGIEGFLFAAEKVGMLLSLNAVKVDVGWLLQESIESCGEQQTWTALREAAAKNPQIEVYRSLAEERLAKRDTYRRNQELLVLDYEQLKPKLPEFSNLWLEQWGEKTSIANLETAARGLLTACDLEEQLRHLRMFNRRAFPLEHSHLLELLSSENERLALAAARALAQITHPYVRELAFRLIETHALGREEAIEMLDRNYQQGDHEIVLGWFEVEEDRGTQHRLGLDLRNFWERHPDPSTEVRMLSAMYEKGPCSECRWHVVRRLIELEALTEDMRAECLYDAHEETRKAALFP